jgi:hypothetical protein
LARANLYAKLIKSLTQLNVLTDGALDFATSFKLASAAAARLAANRLLVLAYCPLGSLTLSLDLALKRVCQVGHIL